MAREQMKKARLLPDYEVHVIDKTITVKKTRYISGEKVEGKKASPGHFEHYETKIPAGWVVCFPRGHSIHITSKEEMIRLGFAEYEDEDAKEGFVLKSPAVTDHSTGLRLEGDNEIMSLATMIAAKTSLKKMGRIPINVGNEE